MAPLDSAGPDVVVAGAARAGTSYLCGALGKHPAIDPGALKEPNYFSSQWTRGRSWYDSLYQPARADVIRLDGSVSLTFPQHPLALGRLREQSPDSLVVYTVREPVARLVSHYQLSRYAGRPGRTGSFAEEVGADDMFLGASDYMHWLSRLVALFPVDRILVVPFPVITADVDAAVGVILSLLGLPPSDGAAAVARVQRNQVRELPNPALRLLSRRLHGSRIYPALRRRVGANRLRRVRDLMTTSRPMPSAAEELATCDPDLRARIDAVAAASNRAVAEWLREQDERLGLAWSGGWAAHVARPEPGAVAEPVSGPGR